MKEAHISDPVKEKNTKNTVPLVSETAERYNKEAAKSCAEKAEPAQKQVEDIAQVAATRAMTELLRRLNLDSEIEQASSDTLGKEFSRVRPKRIQVKVNVNGQDRWIHGFTYLEVCEDYVGLLEREGLIQWTGHGRPIPILEIYLKKFVETFKNGQASLTMKNRDGVIKKHIIPKLGKKRLDEITTTDIQEWYNELSKTYSKETIQKIRNTISPAMDAAVEESLIPRNPFKSIKLEIGGKETIHHRAIPKAKMNVLKNAIPEMKEQERYMFALLSYTGMRFEEVLGFRWEDYDGEWLSVEIAVVHTTRNMPEIKPPKTATSRRKIPCPAELKAILGDGKKQRGFMVWSPKDSKHETPMSYTEARNTFNRVRDRFQLDGYSAHDFRDTCATEWRENGMPLDLIARLLGHAKTETTEKRYVKYRDNSLNSVRALM